MTITLTKGQGPDNKQLTLHGNQQSCSPLNISLSQVVASESYLAEHLYLHSLLSFCPVMQPVIQMSEVILSHFNVLLVYNLSFSFRDYLKNL